jgi:hypothetical protein
MCVIFVLCLIVLPLPPGKNSFAIKINNNNNNSEPHELQLGISWRWVVSFTNRPLYPREKNPPTHWIVGWVGPRIGPDDVERRRILTLQGLELGSFGRPALGRVPVKVLLSRDRIKNTISIISFYFEPHCPPFFFKFLGVRRD